MSINSKKNIKEHYATNLLTKNDLPILFKFSLIQIFMKECSLDFIFQS